MVDSSGAVEAWLARHQQRFHEEFHSSEAQGYAEPMEDCTEGYCGEINPHRRTLQAIAETAREGLEAREGERCDDCGQRYDVVWWAEGDLWQRLTGKEAGGMLCPHCFHERGIKAGIVIEFRAAAIAGQGASGEGQ